MSKEKTAALSGLYRPLWPALALLAASCVLFMTLGANGHWDFVLPRRGMVLASLLLVAYSVGVSTLLFQTLTNNPILTPKITPTSGTINCAVGGRREINAINSSIPAIAAAAPTDILNSGATDGANSIISSKAKAALWLAPTIEGSTKRFFIRICIIMPATASDAPLNTTANVRGRRLISINCILSAEEKIRGTSAGRLAFCPA